MSHAKKYQVFISSTFRDLVEERQDTMKSVLDMGHIPSGMEVFPAADVEQFEYIKKIIDECDYYVLIIGARYGSVDAAGVSFTQKEYEYAVSQNKVVLVFIHNDLGNIPSSKTDLDPELRAKLERFRSQVARSRLVQFWRRREDLNSKVIISLHKAMAEMPAVGWLRADAAASEDLLAQINQLRLENERIKIRAARNDTPRKRNVNDTGDGSAKSVPAGRSGKRLSKSALESKSGLESKSELESMQFDEIWNLHEAIAEALSTRIVQEKKLLEKRLEQLSIGDQTTANSRVGPTRNKGGRAD